MSVIAKDEQKQFHLPPTGNQQAVCFDVWDVGLQESTWGDEKKVQHKVWIAWELEERISSDDEFNGQRHRIHKKYTLTLGDKATLNKDLSSWRGRPFTDEEKKGFDLEKLIGINCLLNIIHNKDGDKTYANIAAVAPLPKGLTKIAPENKRSVPEWIKKQREKAVNSLEENDATESAEMVGDPFGEEDEVPF